MYNRGKGLDELIVTGIQKNPREIKRFLNSFIPIKAVFSNGKIYDPEILMLLHIFQFRWPNFHKAIFDSETLREDLNTYLDFPMSDLFQWDEIENDGKKVMDLLETKFGQGWARKANFEKIDDVTALTSLKKEAEAQHNKQMAYILMKA